MTDLNKEIELCNQSFEKYWDDFCEAYGNGFDRSLAKLFFANAWGEAKAQAVPEGYCLVPKEPTDKMLKRGNRLALSDSQYRYDAASIYEVMLEASESGAEG